MNVGEIFFSSNFCRISEGKKMKVEEKCAPLSPNMFRVQHLTWFNSLRPSLPCIRSIEKTTCIPNYTAAGLDVIYIYTYIYIYNQCSALDLKSFTNSRGHVLLYYVFLVNIYIYIYTSMLF